MPMLNLRYIHLQNIYLTHHDYQNKQLNALFPALKGINFGPSVNDNVKDN